MPLLLGNVINFQCVNDLTLLSHSRHILKGLIHQAFFISEGSTR